MTSSPPAAPGADAAPIFNPRQLLDMVGDDQAAACEISQAYLLQADRLLPALAAAWKARDPQAASALLHKLGGGSRSIGAEQLGLLCRRLETNLSGPLPLWSEYALTELTRGLEATRREIHRALPLA